jgi:hypothetical protein
MNLNEFLRAFFPDENEAIHFRAFKPKDAPDTGSNRPQMLSTTRKRLSEAGGEIELRKLNHLHGVYFAPNAGGSSDEKITRFNAVFVENDRLSIEEQHADLDECPVPTSIRVETKRSVHGYWLLNENCTAEEWRDVQKRLIAYFEGDKAIKNPSRVMRLPFFMHLTYNEQATGSYDCQRVEVVQFSLEIRYSIAELKAAFPEVEKLNGNALNSFEVSEIIGNGNRNNELFSLAGSLRRKGLGENEIAATLREINRTRVKPPLPETEIISIAKSVVRYEPQDNAFNGNSRNNHDKERSEKDRDSTKFRFTRLDELLSEPEEETSFVWENTLPFGGFSICSAKPKVGKSTMARNLAVAISKGKSFLNRAVVRGKVLYLCLEEKRSEIAKHFRAMQADSGDIFVHTGATPENAVAKLTSAIAEFEPVLVIIDPLSRVLRVRDFNDYGGMARGLEPLVDLARKMNCHILALHHDSKMERSGGDALLGSTAIFGAVDCHIQLKKRDKSRTISTTQRYGEDIPETVIELDKETGVITGQGDFQSFMLWKAKDAILRNLTNSEEITELQIKERVEGFSQGVISKALRELVEGKKLNRQGEGKKGKPYTYTKKE